MTLKRITSILLAITYLFVLSGCNAGKKDTKELVIWHVGAESQAQTIIEIGKEFTAQTGVAIICQAISWGNAHSKYLTSIAGDVSPDIGTMGLTWGMEFGELGALLDLRREFPEDVASLESKMFRGLLRSTRVGDKVYGIPFDLTEQIMYYRLDMVPEAPQTWEELLDTLKSLKPQGKGMILDWGSLEWIGYSPFLWQAGGRFYNSDYTKATLNTPEAARALNYMADLYKNGVPKTKVPLELGMRTGDYPLAISGNWKIISLTVGVPEIKDKWSIAMLPKGPSGKRTSLLGGRIMAIFSRSNKKEIAWEFIKFLFKPENQLKMYQATLDTEDAYLPPNMDTWSKLPMDEKFKEVLESQAKGAKGPPPVLAWDSSTRFINNAVQMVILKGADAALELDEATRKMQKELDR